MGLKSLLLQHAPGNQVGTAIEGYVQLVEHAMHREHTVVLKVILTADTAIVSRTFLSKANILFGGKPVYMP